MPSLTDPFPEVLEEVVLKLESVEDVISLGSSCTDLARIVGQERIWRDILAKTQLVEDGEDEDEDGSVMEDRVRTITTFLSSLENSDDIFSLIHQTIYERYPATHQEEEEDNMTVTVVPPPPISTRCLALGWNCCSSQVGRAPGPLSIRSKWVVVSTPPSCSPWPPWRRRRPWGWRWEASVALQRRKGGPWFPSWRGAPAGG